MSMPSIILGAGGGGSALGSLLPWLLLLMGIVVVGGVIISLIRRWMRGTDTGSQIGFTLSDLRAMHAEGRLSSEELAKAEKKLIDHVRSNLTEEDLQRRARIQAQRTTGPSSRTTPPSDEDLIE